MGPKLYERCPYRGGGGGGWGGNEGREGGEEGQVMTEAEMVVTPPLTKE